MFTLKMKAIGSFETSVTTYNLWWAKWHWDRVFSEFFGFPANIIPPSFSILIYHLGNEHYVR
jgi:hypothetical protein